ncbi:unnamed protein product [Rotaria sp. Silwood2]|nr:unnamed protein product [Rotaria sp. Silwood2]CAF4631683.1 unnamed protein product [Rotaria sp. Silwood2]
MRTLWILLSIVLFLTLIQYSAGGSKKPDSWESEEDDSVEMKNKMNLPSISDNNDESDEIAMKTKFYADQFTEDDQPREEKNQDNEALELAKDPEESNSHSVEHDHNDYSKILRDSDDED